MSTSKPIILRPGITNPAFWNPVRPPKAEWERIRKEVLLRDNLTCLSCGHRSLKWMNIHHLEEGCDNSLNNLATICVACHTVLHLGRSLSLHTIEIWKADVSQLEIVQTTRSKIKAGMSLDKINNEFRLEYGAYDPNSLDYANDLIARMGNSPRAYLDEPLCAIFVGLNRWQVE